MSRLTPCNYCNLEQLKREHPGETLLLKATNDRYPDTRLSRAPLAPGAPSPLLPEMIAVRVEGSERILATMDTIPTRCAC